mgnify:CR=1 FL=1
MMAVRATDNLVKVQFSEEDRRTFVAVRSLDSGKVDFVRKEYIYIDSSHRLRLGLAFVDIEQLFEDTGYSGNHKALLVSLADGQRIRVDLNRLICREKVQPGATVKLASTQNSDEEFALEGVEEQPEVIQAPNAPAPAAAAPAPAAAAPAPAPAAAALF